MDYGDSKYYFSKQLGWLEFNNRVLEEAHDSSNPLLERLKFLAITASNLDEFFMIRVARLKDRVDAGYTSKDKAGYRPKELLKEVSKEIHKMVTKQYYYLNDIIDELEKENIQFVDYGELNEREKNFLDDYFKDIIYPVVTPMAIDESRPFPLILNESLNLGVRLKSNNDAKIFPNKGGDELFSVVRVPSILDRIVKLPSQEGEKFILLEDIIKEYLDELFVGYEVQSVDLFRITRNAEVDLDEGAQDLLAEMEKYVKRRKWGFPVRLEIEEEINPKFKKLLIDMLELTSKDIYQVPGPIDLAIFMNFTGIEEFDHLRFESLLPQPVKEFYEDEDEDIFDVIRKKDVLVHHPYQSFSPVIKLVKKAAEDPQVLAIKQTLYRVSGDSPIIKALAQAAENGKQVTVLVELKARFDEENNIEWAKKLEESGCHVVYGLAGLKVHSKLLLVVREEDDGIRRYVHLGTGNYNDKTAKLYTDLGIFTSKDNFGADLSAMFNLLTGYSAPPQWKKLAVAPLDLRERFIEMIRREIEQVKAGKDGHIIAKMNALVDKRIIKMLYEASSHGIKIDLIVRGMCCLRPGVEGISENIRVISIVGRLLEHSRIFYFKNGGMPEIFLSSADWRPRNLDRRVEALFPVEQKDLREEIIELLNITLRDTVKARVQQPDGSYKRVDKQGKEKLESQLKFHDIAISSLRKLITKKGMKKFEPKVSPKVRD